MRLLLDSNVLLWWAGLDAHKLSGATRTSISDAEAVAVSLATVWELEIKRSLGKLVFPFDDWDTVTKAGFSLLPIGFDHIQKATRLPFVHKDPFDRLLVGQALCEGLVVVSSDTRLQEYGVPLLQP